MDKWTKRFRFDKEADIALVNTIMLAEAHVAKNWEVKEKFNGAFNMFCVSRAVASKVEECMPKPKLSTIQEHFRKLIKNRCAANRSNDAASGISEVYGDLEQSLDVAIEEIEEKK